MSKADRLTIAHKALASKPKFYLEDLDVLPDGDITVTYIDESILNSGEATEQDWLEGKITLKQLEDFVINHYSNIVDTVTHSGYHEQSESDINVAIYLMENLRNVLVDYLNAGKDVLSC